MTQYRSWPGTAAASPRCGRKVSHEGGWFPHCPSPNSRMLQNLRGWGSYQQEADRRKWGQGPGSSTAHRHPPSPLDVPSSVLCQVGDKRLSRTTIKQPAKQPVTPAPRKPWAYRHGQSSSPALQTSLPHLRSWDTEQGIFGPWNRIYQRKP